MYIYFNDYIYFLAMAEAFSKKNFTVKLGRKDGVIVLFVVVFANNVMQVLGYLK